MKLYIYINEHFRAILLMLKSKFTNKSPETTPTTSSTTTTTTLKCVIWKKKLLFWDEFGHFFLALKFSFQDFYRRGGALEKVSIFHSKRLLYVFATDWVRHFNLPVQNNGPVIYLMWMTFLNFIFSQFQTLERSFT